MNEYQWNPLGIVRLKKTETVRACEMTYRERARNPVNVSLMCL